MSLRYAFALLLKAHSLSLTLFSTQFSLSQLSILMIIVQLAALFVNLLAADLQKFQFMFPFRISLSLLSNYCVCNSVFIVVLTFVHGPTLIFFVVSMFFKYYNYDIVHMYIEIDRQKCILNAYTYILCMYRVYVGMRYLPRYLYF